MKRQALLVEDLMSTAVIAVKESTPIERAYADMKLADIRHFPIVDERGRVVGILSDRDVLRALGTKRERATVREIMTRTVRTVQADTPAHEAAAILLENKIGSLPIVDLEGHPVGIITDTDFLQVAREALLGRMPVRREP